MGRSGITYSDVNNAIAELQGKQQNPTVDAIRGILGTGSKSTIARLLREWKAEQGLQPTDDASIPSELLGLVKGLWERVQEKAQAQGLAYQKESDAKVALISEQLNQSEQRQHDLQSKIHQLEEQRLQQNQAHKKLQALLNIEVQEKMKLTTRVSILDAHQQTNLAENERLHQLLKQVQHNLEHYQTATQEQRQEQALQLEKQQHAHQQTQAQLQKQLDTVNSQKQQFQAQATQINQSYQSLEAEHKALVLQYKNTQKQADLLNITHQKLQQSHDQLLQQSQQQAENLEGKNHTAIELQLKLKTAKEKLDSLTKALSQAEDKIGALRRDYQFAAQENANLTGQITQLETLLAKKIDALS